MASGGHRPAHGPFALNLSASFTDAALYVVWKQVVPTPSWISNCAVTGRTSGRVGIGRLAPLPPTCTLALPATPAPSLILVMPSGSASLFVILKPLVPVAFQHGFVPHMPPARIADARSGCDRTDPS